MDVFEDTFAGASEQVLVVEVPPQLDAQTADELRAHIVRRFPNRDDAALVLDCTTLELVTSIGVAALLQIEEFCADQGAGCRLAGVSPRVRKMFDVLSLDHRFIWHDDVADAVAAFDMA